MSFRERLRNLESQFRPEPFPDFEVCCKRRWTPRQWFSRLADSGDPARVRATLRQMIDGVPDDDTELQEWLLATDLTSLALPPGAIPSERPGPDRFLTIVQENMHALRAPRATDTTQENI